MTAPSDNLTRLREFLGELQDFTDLLERERRYSECLTWLKLWSERVVTYIQAVYGQSMAEAFVGAPSLGTFAIRDKYAWRKKIKRRKDFLSSLVQQEETALVKDSDTSVEPVSRDELISQLLASWHVVSRAGKLNQEFVQNVHDKSIAALAPLLTTLELERFRKLDPKSYKNQFLDGFDVGGLSSYSPLSECAKGWSLQLNLLKLGLDENRKRIVNHSDPSTSAEHCGNKRVFIMHGHDNHNLLEIKEMIRGFGLEPIVMKDEVHDGFKTFLDKFEDLASSCGYAIALITKDDCVVKDDVEVWQGRPNAIFELGWFCKHFARKRILMIVQSGCNVWSDLQGVEYERFETDVNSAYRKVHLSLKAAKVIDS